MSEPRPRPGIVALDRALAVGNMEAVKRSLFELDDTERQILEAQMGTEALGRAYRSARSRRRGPGFGRVVVLPGLMGTQLDSVDEGGGSDRVWVNFFRIIGGRMDELALGPDGRALPPAHTVKTSGLYKDYLNLLLALDEHWQVRPFGYDWRLDVDLSAQALADDIRTWAQGEPAHILVHSMGGLVARRFVQLFPEVWASMRDPEGRGRGGRLVMLGTPNRGSFSIPGALTGNEDVVKKLALLDLSRGVSGLLKILNTFPGTYQTMPSPRVDLGDDHVKLFEATSWGAFPVLQSLLDAGRRFQETLHPVIDPDRLLYVAGYDQPTPSRIKIVAPGRFEYQQTLDGDGRVPHELGLLKDVPTLYAKEKHGDLSKCAKVLGGIHDLLLNGETSLLESRLPRERGVRTTGQWAPFPARPTPPEVVVLTKQLQAARRSPRVPPEMEVKAARLEALVLSEALGAPSEPEATKAAIRAKAKTKPPSLRVEVVWGDITKVQADVYAVGHYHGVPPQNAVAALDTALSGRSGTRLLADHVRRGLIGGELGTVSFFPWGRRTIAIAGMGFPGTFGEGQLRALARSLTWAVANVPNARTIASVLIGSGEGNLSVADSVMGMFRGMAEALAEGPVKTQVNTLRVVERRRDRAREIQDALTEVRKRLSDQVDLVLSPRIKTAPGAVIGRDEAASLVVGAAVQALAKGASAARRRSLTSLLKADPRAAAAAPGLGQALERLAQTTPGPLVVEVGRGPDAQIPTRISFSGDPLPFRVAAITNTTTVAERPISIDPSLVTDLVERMTDPEPKAAATLSDLLRRLVVPGEFEDLLKGSGVYVFEVDRPMARLHWEMLTSEDGALAPLSVTNALARQLRTVYSAPPAPAVRRGQRTTALVIGDPGDPAKGQSLLGARREAIRVVEILTAHGVEVTARIGAPGAKDVPSGFEPADRLDCLYLLMKGGFDILHYSGHGDFDPERPDRVGWVFKSGLLTARELERLSAPPRLVVANACLSALTSFAKDEAALLPSLADEFFRRGVRDYVGTAWEVNDQGAVLFMERFYAGLLATPGGTLGQAVRDARRALFDERALYGSLWAAYQHYGDPLARIEGESLAETKARPPRRRRR